MPVINQIYTSINSINFGKDALLKLVEILNHLSISKKHSNMNAALESEVFETLEFKNVSFAYNYGLRDEREVLNNNNIKINKGDFVGVIGSSGSGKTTLIDLILCLLFPHTGKITVNDKNIEENIDWWRKKVAYIPQEIFIIDASLKDNILLGDDFNDSNSKKLMTALNSSRLDDLVKSLPNGLDTILGERGVNLSGGQRQRIAIARAIYHDREFLILDESTSALDNETEKEISSVIEKMLPHKTIIAIAHRQSTLKSCNKIFKISDGVTLETSLSAEKHVFMISTKKIISLFTTKRADSYHQRNLISKVKNESSIKFHLVATGNHLSSNQGNTIDEIVKNNPNLFKLDIGSDKTDQESINQNIIKINASVFKYLIENNPDAAILLGDRYEMCVLAQCLYSNRVPIVHLHGGELTLGSLDDGYRHAISKFSMLHFVANETYKDRLIKMGENPDSIHISGAMVIDNILNLKKMTWDEIQKKLVQLARNSY